MKYLIKYRVYKNYKYDSEYVDRQCIRTIKDIDKLTLPKLCNIAYNKTLKDSQWVYIVDYKEWFN